MGGKKSKAPAAPNYDKIAQTEAAENRKTAQELTQWNRPTQNNPFGQITWQQDGAGNWTQNETWDPRIVEGYDKLFEAQQGAYEGLPGAFEGGPAMPQYDEAYRKQYEQDMYDSVMNRARPEQERQQAQFTTRLRQQGLQPGTEAFDRAMQNMMTSHGDVNTQAALQARMEGGNQARQEYTTALQGQNQAYGQAKDIWGSAFDRAGAVQGLMGGQYRPTFSGFSGATGYNPADMMGAANAGYQAKMGNYNAGQQKKGNTMNAAASLGSSAAMMMSDATLKTDIVPLSGREALEALLQLGGYTFRWKDDGSVDCGVMAQEVQRILPELVVKPETFLMVNYTGLVALAIESIKYLAGELKCTHDHK